MPILDYLGRPVDTSVLNKSVATPNVSGVRQPFHEAITGLKPEKLATILQSVDQGDATDYLTLAEEMEEKDTHYRSVLSTRKLAVSSLSIAVDAASDDARDVEMSDAVKRMAKGDAFRFMIADLLAAFGPGYSVSEMNWDKSKKPWRPVLFEHKDPRWFQFDRATGKELRLRDESDPINGKALDPFKFVVHYPRLKTGLPIRGGLARLVAVSYMCKSYTLKDWIVFAEVFGMPLRLGKYQEDATTEQKAALLRALTNIGTDAAAMIPEGMLIEFVTTTASAGGDKLFVGLAEYLDNQVSKAVLGQTMSADSQSSGIGSGNANLHGEVRADYRDDDAMKLAATLNRDVVRPFIDLNWGVPKDEAYPILRLFKEQKEDLKAFTEAIVPFIDRKLRVGASVIRDKFGIEEPAADEEILGPAAASSPFGQPAPDAAPPADAGNLASEQRKAHIALIARVLAGKKLTKAQQQLFTMLASKQDDEIDRLANDALGSWQKVMDPVTEPIIAMAARANSYDELLEDLKNVKLDTNELVKMVATLTFKARGRGDATDEA